MNYVIELITAAQNILDKIEEWSTADLMLETENIERLQVAVNRVIRFGAFEDAPSDPAGDFNDWLIAQGLDIDEMSLDEIDAKIDQWSPLRIAQIRAEVETKMAHS